MGGEKTWFLTNSFPKEGSPPHGRGKVFGLKGGNVVVRITPAWAGKRPWMPSDSSSSRDHPCVGGEKGIFKGALDGRPGSPPRGRGKGRRVVDHHPLPGITPAWAGKSRSILESALVFRDHPRVGGEKLCSSLMRALWSGSPPRGRGKTGPQHRQHRLAGITPAWAGKRAAIGGSSNP